MAAEKVTFFSILKNLFFLLLFVQIAPGIFQDLKKKYESFNKEKVMVGCIPLKGEIQNPEWFLKNLKKMSDDKSLKALWIPINSPGGLPAASQALFLGILEAKKKKPVIVEIQEFACSGAYYAAIASTKIIALPSSLVGNIGIVMQLINLKKSAEYLNMHVEYIKSGAYKDAGARFADLTPEQREQLQSTSDDIYEQFVTDVAQQRNLSVYDHKNWAEGKTFTGRQAFEKGLVDEIGGMQTVIKSLQTILQTDAEIERQYPEPPSFMSRLTGNDDQSQYESTFAQMLQKMGAFLTHCISYFSLHNDQQIQIR